MSVERVRVAVVGVGHLGRIHARIYAQNPGATLVGVVDADAERARAVGEECGVKGFGSVEELGFELDAVSIAVPTVAHEEACVPFLERGIPTLIEKPLAPHVGDADRILRAAERGGARVAVGHVERFQPGVRRLRELGLAPRYIECHRLTEFSFRSLDVGVVHDLMIHDLDLILHLVGSDVASLDAAGGRILTDYEDMASVRLVFENGARANVTASRVSLSPMRRFRMFSSSGYVGLDFAAGSGTYVRKGENWSAGMEALRRENPARLAQQTDFLRGGMLDIHELELAGEERPLQAELDAFLGMVRGDEGEVVSGEEGRRALELADRIQERIRAQDW